MKKMPLTKRQMEIFSFMRLYFMRNDQLPPPEALQERFGWKSAKAVTCARDVLAQKGWIEHNEAGKYRFTRGNDFA